LITARQQKIDDTGQRLGDTGGDFTDFTTVNFSPRGRNMGQNNENTGQTRGDKGGIGSLRPFVTVREIKCARSKFSQSRKCNKFCLITNSYALLPTEES
jgi:hypothetical protein